ncbi:MAG: aspartate aminotransferase family protein [Hyphomonadaceae bacterium]|nr:aspartate aminotransferase family protein [Hyphomonadaceae bacterium]
MTLPQFGCAWPDLEARMRDMAQGDVKWRDGRTGMYVFNAGEDVERVKKAAYAMFSEENGLGPMAFPSLARMEREVVGHALALLRAPEGAGGAMTSGGTDSIVMAVKSARDYARSRGLKGQGNLVAPFTAHPAFHKAAMMMDLDLRRVAAKDLLADAAAMEAACDENTIMLVGSAPCFPFGLIDPVEALSDVALRKNLWLHVDACVGGFLAPFVEMNGVALPAWDFRVAGVRSISSDLHKYGYCSKGASTLLFRDQAMKEHMVFDAGPWPMGRMLTPTLAGTRPGGAIAAAWAVLNYLGVEGYRAKQALVVQAREAIEAGVVKLGFRVLGSPQLGIVSFTHDSANCFDILRGMYKRGWMTASNVDPPSLHLMLSPKHAEVAGEYLRDLEASMKDSAGDTPMPAPGYAR